MAADEVLLDIATRLGRIEGSQVAHEKHSAEQWEDIRQSFFVPNDKQNPLKNESDALKTSSTRSRACSSPSFLSGLLSLQFWLSFWKKP